MARNASNKKEGVFSRMISVVGGGSEESEQSERGGVTEGAESATTLLRTEHDEVRQLFHEFENASEGARSSRKRIIDEASRKLEVHAEMEEKIFYPACRQLEDEEARKMVGESVEEHAIVKRLIQELSGLEASDERFEAKATVLKENVEHHADEEERDLFPVAERELGDERLEELGVQMAELKRRLMSGAPARGGRAGSSRSRGSSAGPRQAGGSSKGRSAQSSRGSSQRRSSAGGRSASASRSRSTSSSSRSRSSSGGGRSRTPTSKKK